MVRVLADGVRASRELRGADGSPPVLALTTFDDDEVLAGVLRADASRFILKGKTPGAVREWPRTEGCVGSHIWQIGLA